MLEDIYPNVRALKGEARFFDEHYDEGIESYTRNLPAMENPNDVIIEKSPQYFTRSGVPSRIYKDSPKSKLILIVCDPVRRVFSNLVQRQSVRFISERKNFLKYLTSPDGTLRTNKIVLKRNQYDKHIKPWLNLFPREQILIINGQGLVENPYSEVVKVENFLGLPNLVKKTTFWKNTKTNFPCWISYKGKNCIDLAIKGIKHPETKDEVKILVDKLRENFIPRNMEFFNLTGITFNWPMNKA